MTGLAVFPSLADACPFCAPLDTRPASMPRLTRLEADGTVGASYECGSCGRPWRTVWGVDGWPLERAGDDVTPLYRCVCGLLSALIHGAFPADAPEPRAA